MESVNFKGFEGLRLADALYSHDMLLLVVCGLLLAFALLFRLNIPLFNNMLGNIKAKEQRAGISEITQKDSFFFNMFMTFQALLLSSILIISIAIEYKYIRPSNEKVTFLAIAGILAFLLVFYLLRIALYAVYRDICSTRAVNFTHYHALLGLFGISLYIPVLWILLIGKYLWVAYIAAAISYPLFRILFFMQFVGRSLIRNMGIAFVSLCLLAQEMVPVVLLYEGVSYIYNIIEKNNIWQ